MCVKKNARTLVNRFAVDDHTAMDDIIHSTAQLVWVPDDTFELGAWRPDYTVTVAIVAYLAVH